MTKSPEQVVAANLEAYNERDLAAFMACFAPGIEVWDQQTGTLLMQGREQVQRGYADLFANSPQLHSRVVHRSVVGTVVIDHEIVTGRHGGDAEILISYQVHAGLVARIWVNRAPLAAAAVVRAAGGEDAAAIAAIGCETYAEHFAHIWSAAGLRGFLDREFDAAGIAQELHSGAASYFLAESQHEVFGYAKLRHPRAMQVESALPGAELQKIYLRSSCLRRGAGQQLLEACVGRTVDLGLDHLWLHVLERNTQATCFYLRHGFKFAGKESFATDGGQEVMLVMMRSLPK